MKGFQFLLLVICCALTFNCQNARDNKLQQLKLSSGSEVEVLYEKQSLPDNPTRLLVEIDSKNKILKEQTLEDDVIEVWAQMKEFADDSEIDEAIIKYRFLADEENQTGDLEQIHIITVFTAEKIENGSWKLDKIG